MGKNKSFPTFGPCLDEGESKICLGFWGVKRPLINYGLVFVGQLCFTLNAQPKPLFHGPWYCIGRLCSDIV